MVLPGEELGLNLAESITMTINKRIGLAKKSIFEIKSIVEDCRSKVTGGIKTGILLWESCVLPFLLNNCSTWVEMKKSDMNRLCKLQNLFLNTLLNVQKCPVPLMYFDLAMTTIPLKILKEKLILFHHISCLPKKAIAYQVLQIQQRLHFPTMFKEVEAFLIENEICDVTKFTEKKWKELTKRKIQIQNRDFLIEEAKRYKKIDSVSLACEDFEMKDYFFNLDLNRARIKFRERSKCMKTCKTHFSSDPRFLEGNYTCVSCAEGKVDTLSHWRECVAYSKFRESRNLESDLDLVNYYQDIIKSRLDEEER